MVLQSQTETHVTVQRLVEEGREGKRSSHPVRAVELFDQACQVGSARGKEVATPSQQTTDTQSVGRNFRATHRTRAFFDPPPTRPFAGMIGAIAVLLVLMTLIPCAIAREAVPEVPPVQKQET